MNQDSQVDQLLSRFLELILWQCPYVDDWKDILRKVEKAAALKTPDWSYDFWILYDISWSLSAALIQLYLDWTRDPARRKYFDHLQELTRTQRSIFNQLISGVEHSDYMIRMSSIAGHFPLCLHHRCTCFQDAFNVEVLFTSLSNHLSPSSVVELTYIKHSPSSDSEGGTSISPIIAIQTMLIDSIHSVLDMLNQRERAHCDCNRDLQDLAYVKTRATKTEIWYMNESESAKSNSNGDEDFQETFYIVSCPELHVISYEDLSGLIEASPMETGMRVRSKRCIAYLCCTYS